MASFLYTQCAPRLVISVFFLLVLKSFVSCCERGVYIPQIDGMRLPRTHTHTHEPPM